MIQKKVHFSLFQELGEVILKVLMQTEENIYMSCEKEIRLYETET